MDKHLQNAPPPHSATQPSVPGTNVSLQSVGKTAARWIAGAIGLAAVVYLVYYQLLWRGGWWLWHELTSSTREPVAAGVPTKSVSPTDVPAELLLKAVGATVVAALAAGVGALVKRRIDLRRMLDKLEVVEVGVSSLRAAIATTGHSAAGANQIRIHAQAVLGIFRDEDFSRLRRRVPASRVYEFSKLLAAVSVVEDLAKASGADNVTIEAGIVAVLQGIDLARLRADVRRNIRRDDVDPEDILRGGLAHLGGGK